MSKAIVLYLHVHQPWRVRQYTVFDTAESHVYFDEASDKAQDNKEIFLKAWKAAGGNVSRLSNLLSVSRVTLYRYIKKYGLEK